ncbi:hypothetical protein [Stieleria varia]|uniref:hypothetical protein n=1 Tax=Stieleria varia TaxID=2528005 RepID=UPI0011B49676|nr:hypothetical protein [Stieleria varia]
MKKLILCSDNGSDSEPIATCTKQSIALILSIATLISIGCSVPMPGGGVMVPEVLGSKVDEIHRQQEQNAELAKLIIYAHEFEMNLQEDPARRAASEKSDSTFSYYGEVRPRGLRLTPAGEDHVKKIAEVLRNGQQNGALTHAVIERSQTSKRWDTEHQYPVHRNSELDAMRRAVVVRALESLGVIDADELVIVAPAFPTGLDAPEAAAAYRNATVTTRGNTNY